VQAVFPINQEAAVSHTLRGKAKLLNRVRRIRGQIEAIERALEAEATCAEVMQQITSCRGAVNGLLAEVVQDHITAHFSSAPANIEASEQLLEVVHSYFK
jgi:DNA-binding FrmR family transcriptional regulator